MSDINKVGDLEINQDLEFQKKEWSVERLGWFLMTLLALAGLLGLFGEGPLSSTRVQNGPVRVTYGRFERLLAPIEVTVQLDSSLIQNGEARLRVDETLLKNYTIQRLIPEPDSEELQPDHITFVYKVPKNDAPLQITLHLQGNRLGITEGQIGAEDGSQLAIKQFIYP